MLRAQLSVHAQSKSYISNTFSSNFYSFCFGKKTHYFSVFSLISFCHFRAYLFSQIPQLRVIFVLILAHFKIFKRKCFKVSTNKDLRNCWQNTYWSVDFWVLFWIDTIKKQSRFVCLEITFLVLLFCLKLFSDIADTSKFLINSVTKQH